MRGQRPLLCAPGLPPPGPRSRARVAGGWPGGAGARLGRTILCERPRSLRSCSRPAAAKHTPRVCCFRAALFTPLSSSAPPPRHATNGWRRPQGARRLVTLQHWGRLRHCYTGDSLSEEAGAWGDCGGREGQGAWGAHGAAAGCLWPGSAQDPPETGPWGIGMGRSCTIRPQEPRGSPASLLCSVGAGGSAAGPGAEVGGWGVAARAARGGPAVRARGPLRGARAPAAAPLAAPGASGDGWLGENAARVPCEPV
ncbi:MAG: hypothetical protein J3K34DRAFT_172329 [Monoraphidium minutum]|nr:MAG: hypothetical protein J3K34DRAFT_172329 [Monoraphidium minutum]